MNKQTWFDSPLLLGFEHMTRLAEQAARSSADGYPPYNIEERGGGDLRITLAVAGFEPDELSASVQGAQLTLSGEKGGGADRAFLHRGIAARRFARTFVLADGYHVERAALEHGLLHVDVRRRRADDAVRTIEISSPGGA